MRTHVGLPLNLWAIAINTIVYLINKGPFIALDGGIPKEMWIGKRVNYYFLRVFGCEAFPHIDKKIEIDLMQSHKNAISLGMELMV